MTLFHLSNIIKIYTQVAIGSCNLKNYKRLFKNLGMPYCEQNKRKPNAKVQVQSLILVLCLYVTKYLKAAVKTLEDWKALRAFGNTILDR